MACELINAAADRDLAVGNSAGTNPGPAVLENCVELMGVTPCKAI